MNNIVEQSVSNYKTVYKRGWNCSDQAWSDFMEQIEEHNSYRPYIVKNGISFETETAELDSVVVPALRTTVTFVDGSKTSTLMTEKDGIEFVVQPGTNERPKATLLSKRYALSCTLNKRLVIIPDENYKNPMDDSDFFEGLDLMVEGASENEQPA